jgi:alpha/beta superfamily hydrolase
MNDLVRRLTIESKDASLEAVLEGPNDTGRNGVIVVCHPHPLYGGSMYNNVVDALCDAALQEGLSALRFNFRGVGASTGAHTRGISEVDDVIAVVDTALAEIGTGGPPAIGLAGYSFGAGVAAWALSRCQTPLQALVLVSPPLGDLATALIGDGTLEGPYSWGSQRHGPPLLLATGGEDNVCPAAELEALAGRLDPRPSCIVEDGANHSWLTHEAALRDAVGGFLRWNLTGH